MSVRYEIPAGRRRKAYLAIIKRYAQLAGLTLQLLPQVPVARIWRPAPPPPSRSDIIHQATLRQRARLAEVFGLAQSRNAISFTVDRLRDGWKCKEIAVALRAMPEALSRRHGPSLAERMAAVPQPNVGSGPSVRDMGGTSRSMAAAIVRSYNKAVGR